MSKATDTVLLSDIHLSASAPEITARLQAFLGDQLDNVGTMYLLGDIFDYWIGDDLALAGKDPLAVALAKQLKQLSEQGLQIYFMPGNRDFLIGERYAQMCGVQCLNDPTVININDRRILLAHGDAWCTDDLPYQQFRQMVRNPQWQETFLAQPLEKRLEQAAQARAASQQHTSNSSDEIMDVNPSQVQQAFAEHQVDLIIHGHTHRPADHHYPSDTGNNTRMVLGDWYEQASWLRINQHGIMRHGVTLAS